MREVSGGWGVGGGGGEGGGGGGGGHGGSAEGVWEKSPPPPPPPLRTPSALANPPPSPQAQAWWCGQACVRGGRAVWTRLPALRGGGMHGGPPHDAARIAGFSSPSSPPSGTRATPAPPLPSTTTTQTRGLPPCLSLSLFLPLSPSMYSSQMEGPRPSCLEAPSDWKAEVATPQGKGGLGPAGSRPGRGPVRSTFMARMVGLLVGVSGPAAAAAAAAGAAVLSARSMRRGAGDADARVRAEMARTRAARRAAGRMACKCVVVLFYVCWLLSQREGRGGGSRVELLGSDGKTQGMPAC